MLEDVALHEHDVFFAEPDELEPITRSRKRVRQHDVADDAHHDGRLQRSNPWQLEPATVRRSPRQRELRCRHRGGKSTAAQVENGCPYDPAFVVIRDELAFEQRVRGFSG
jgi:hypothetical protein